MSLTLRNSPANKLIDRFPFPVEICDLDLYRRCEAGSMMRRVKCRGRPERVSSAQEHGLQALPQ
jgi:hypothetical protein